MLTSAPCTSYDTKTINFCIENSVLYLSKKSITTVQNQFTTFGSLTSVSGTLVSIFLNLFIEKISLN
jgi:hypothetical protein